MTPVTIKRAFTGDRGPPGDAREITVNILTAEQIGPKMSKLPNGSLLCRDVPIARAGWMIYGPGETPIPVGPMGVAYVERTADDLFSPETIGSFMGSAVVDEHPSYAVHADGVVPANWRQLSRGFATTNVRRGTGDNADVLLADLIITDAELIASVLAGKREVSCGYDADYTPTGYGLGRQTKIVGNHIALVRKGRCGPRCAIGDQAHLITEEGKTMKRVPIKATRRAVVDSATLDAARQRVADAQAEVEELEEGAEGEEDGATHIHIHTADEEVPRAHTDDRIAVVEEGLATLAATVGELVAAVKGGKTNDGGCPECAKLSADGEKKTCPDCAAKEKKKTDDALSAAAAAALLAAEAGGDSKALETSYGKVIAQAEVLVPGFRMPTFDAAAKRAATVDNMCAARRKCLNMAYSTTDGKALIDDISGGTSFADIEKMDCAQAAIVFSAAATAKAATNNRAAVGDGTAGAQLQQAARKGPMTAAEMNKANAEFWSKQEVTAGA